MADEEIVILNNKQLLELAELVYRQELEAINNINFGSEHEQVKYLHDCEANKDTVVKLLNDGGALVTNFENDGVKSPIAHNILSYFVNGLNYGLQGVRNYTLRTDYLKKIRGHADSLMTALEEVGADNVEHLANDASLYRKAMKEALEKLKTDVSRAYSQRVNDSRITFPDLIRGYQEQLGYGDGPFSELEAAQKLEVYEEIIEESGRGSSKVAKLLGSADLDVILFTAAMMVWDIYSSDHDIETVVRDAVNAIAVGGGAILGKVVEEAVATGLADVEGTALFVLATGMITSFGGTFIIVTAAGLIMDLIFGSGGSAPLSTDEHRCYVAPMPDGMTLARQLAYHPTN